MKADTKERLQLAAEDFEVGMLLYRNERFPNTVFYMCQAVENILQAARTEFADTPLEKNRNLVQIADKTGLQFAPDQVNVLRVLTQHYCRVQYPNSWQDNYHKRRYVSQIVKQALGIYQWTANKIQAN